MDAATQRRVEELAAGVPEITEEAAERIALVLEQHPQDATEAA